MTFRIYQYWNTQLETALRIQKLVQHWYMLSSLEIQNE